MIYLAQAPAPGPISSEVILASYTTASGWAMQFGAGLVALTAVAALMGFLIRKYSS